MKKMLLVILLVFSFYNVYAVQCDNSGTYGVITGGVKYEITHLQVDNCDDSTDICVNIQGWAVLPRGSHSINQSGVRMDSSDTNTYDIYGNKFDSGYCAYGSNVFKTSNGSDITDSGTRDERYLYQYKLIVYDADGNRLGDSVTNSDIIKFSRRPISLTYLQAVKQNGNTGQLESGEDQGKTACYEDVGFSFTANLSKLSSSVNGFKFKLNISTGSMYSGTSPREKTIDVSVIETSGTDSLDGEIDYEVLDNTVSTVKNYMTNGYGWGTANSYSTKSSSYCISAGSEFTVLDRQTYQNISWYKVQKGSNYFWIPASWTEPVASRATIITTDIQDKEPDSCKKNTSGLPVKKECEKCADSVTINTDDIENCKSLETETDFYEITCTDDITTSFNPDNLNLKKGQGFYYGIDVVSSRECEGKFNGEKWLEAYNIAIANRKKYENSPSDYERNETKLNDLLNAVDSYNNYVMEDKNNPTATIDINYYVNEKKKILNYNFASEVVNEGVGEFTEKNTINLNIAGLTNPSNFKYSNKSNKRHVRLFPPKVYLEKNTGEIVTSSHKNKINGGNKFYTAIDSDLREFYLEIKVNNLGKNGKSSILNKKCSGLLYDVKEQYRIIDTSNPFINAERYKNTNNNWKNNDYDFTKTIGNNNGILYSFSLTNSDISEIKSDNIKNWNSYLGTCYNNISEMSPIFKRICETINSK